MKTHLAAARRGIVLILLAVYLAGCTSWQAVGGVGGADRVRITRSTGERLELERPIVRGDSIIAGSVAIPRSDVARVEARRFSAGRTILLVATVAAAFPLLYMAGWAFCDAPCGD